MSKLYYIAGGGTAGHVNPALAIAESIMSEDPENRIIFFVTENGVEKTMTQNAGYEHIVIKASRLPNSLTNVFVFGASSLSGYRTCTEQIKKERPTAVFGTGGFVCGPLLMAAEKMGVPYIIHEQNALPGKANRFFAKKASAICTSFENSNRYFKTDAPIIHTGNPIRRIFFERTSKEARDQLQISSDKFIVLIMGGSLGAEPINQSVVEILKKGIWQKMKRRYPELILAVSSGQKKYAELKKAVSAYDFEDILIEPYLDTTLWLAASDLYIGRAGASSCFESAATATPAIFLPYPHSADNHQYFNAKDFADEKAAILIENRDFNGEIMMDHIRYLIENRSLLYKMSQRVKAKAMPDAADKIVEVINRYAVK